MRQKKVVIFIPSIEKGGVEKNLFIISDFLLKKFNDLTIISASKKAKKKFNKKIKFLSPKSEIWDNFGRNIKYFISILFLIKKILHNRNIIVLSFQANIYAIVICKIFFVKIITRSNSFPDDWSNNFLKKFIFKNILGLADKNIVNSIEVKNKFKSKYKINPKCIYNPLNKKQIIKLSKHKVKKIYFKKNALKIIQVGRFSEEKDHDTLLKSLFILKKKINFEAVLLGSGKLKKNIQDFIKINELKHNVKIIDYKQNPYPYIKQADFLILTSLHEGLPNILLEALTLNKFIISSNCETGPKEILLNGKGGALFKVKNYNDLSKKIIFYLNKKSSREQKIKLAKSKLYKFNYLENLNKYYELLKKYI